MVVAAVVADRGRSMSGPKLDLQPPWLQGVYLRDDFDFELRSSAITSEPEMSTETPSDESSFDSLLMSDDEFLKSITTPSESESSKPDPVVENATGDRLLPADPKVGTVPRNKRFPFSLPWVAGFHLEFKTAVTFLVGENGSGKSTLIEALASLSGYPVCGGGKNDLASQFGPERQSELAQAMYVHFKKRPRDGYFFRAEFYAQFASLLDQRKRDPEFKEDPYTRYGGQSPHTRSHGESFLDFVNHRVGAGLYLLDEPESALSPQRQLTLLAIMARLVKEGKTQFIVATHSPILMTFPGATILGLGSGPIQQTTLEETQHYQLTRGILEFPEKYWRHLIDEDESQRQ
jgi:predicted ATPase